MSAFNLVSTAWIPVVRASGRLQRIRPAALANEIATDPVVDVEFARPDFRCATIEFIIGLLTVAYPPRDNWAAAWMTIRFPAGEAPANTLPRHGSVDEI